MTQDWNIYFDYKIYFAQMKKLFLLYLLYFFLSLTKADQALFDRLQTTLRLLIILAVQNLMSLRNIQL